MVGKGKREIGGGIGDLSGRALFGQMHGYTLFGQVWVKRLRANQGCKFGFGSRHLAIWSNASMHQ